MGARYSKLPLACSFSPLLKQLAGRGISLVVLCGWMQFFHCTVTESNLKAQIVFAFKSAQC